MINCFAKLTNDYCLFMMKILSVKQDFKKDIGNSALGWEISRDPTAGWEILYNQTSHRALFTVCVPSNPIISYSPNKAAAPLLGALSCLPQWHSPKGAGLFHTCLLGASLSRGRVGTDVMLWTQQLYDIPMYFPLNHWSYTCALGFPHKDRGLAGTGIGPS